jgi:hypothetical protein
VENMGRLLRKGDLVSIRGNSIQRCGVVLEVMDVFAIVFWNIQRPYEIEHIIHLEVISQFKT